MGGGLGVIMFEVLICMYVLRKGIFFVCCKFLSYLPKDFFVALTLLGFYISTRLTSNPRVSPTDVVTQVY